MKARQQGGTVFPQTLDDDGGLIGHNDDALDEQTNNQQRKENDVEAPPSYDGGFSPRTRKWLSAEPFGQQLSPSRILVLSVGLRVSKQATCPFGTRPAKITRTLLIP